MTILKNCIRFYGSVTMSLFFGTPQMFLTAEGNPPMAAAEMVVTIQPTGSVSALNVQPEHLKIYQGEAQRVVNRIERLSNERAAMELLIYVDHSIDTATFETIQPELEHFIRALPETTKIAITDGTVMRSFTTNHEIAAHSLKQSSPNAEPPETYSTLLNVTRQWPSSEQTGRRAVLVITGSQGKTNNSYVEPAWRNAQIAGIAMYSVFVDNNGRGSAVDRVGDTRQSGLLALTDATGGHSYWTNAANPDLLGSQLQDLTVRFSNQYKVVFEPKNHAGNQPVRVQSDITSMTITAPASVYVRPSPPAPVLKRGLIGEE